MNRYDIARGEVPDKKEPEKTLTFGFGNESVGSSGKYELFRPKPSTTHRVGIIYTDANKLFVGTKLHFHNSYFLCKTVKDSNRKEICCVRKGNPRFRVACAIIDYGAIQSNVASLNSFRVLPWAFSYRDYQNLNEVHKLSPLNLNDFSVTCVSMGHFNSYNLGPITGSIMKRSKRQDEIINTAIPIIRNLKNYLGRDLSISDMWQLLDEPDRYNRRNRGNTGINRRLDQI